MNDPMKKNIKRVLGMIVASVLALALSLTSVDSLLKASDSEPTSEVVKEESEKEPKKVVQEISPKEEKKEEEKKNLDSINQKK